MVLHKAFYYSFSCLLSLQVIVICDKLLLFIAEGNSFQWTLCIENRYNYTVSRNMNFFLFEMWLIISYRFCYAEYESDDQIGLLCQDFEKIGIKCAKKGNFGHIRYAIMAKVIFFSEL